jgi:hypothetical protein
LRSCSLATCAGTAIDGAAIIPAAMATAAQRRRGRADAVRAPSSLANMSAARRTSGPQNVTVTLPYTARATSVGVVLINSGVNSR